jgi:hypothetical protein
MPERSINSRPADLLEHEFAQEKASALGRLGRALEAALAALFELDNGGPAAQFPAEQRERRAALVERASIALWHFIVQREACGLRDMRNVLRDYGVPAEVAARMGAAPAREAARREPRLYRQSRNMLTNHPRDGHEQ